MSENGLGHNVNGGMTEDQLQALGYHHKSKYEQALAAKKETDAKFKHVCKVAKADGVSVDDIKLLIKLDTPEGEASLRAELQRQLQVAGWAGSEIGTQFSFADIPDRSPLVERAAAEGKRAGMKGESLNNPYTGDAAEAYAQGWHDGQAALFSVRELSEARAAAETLSEEGEGEEGEEAEPAPKRSRGRPKGSKNRAKADAAPPVDPFPDEPATEGATQH